MRSIAYESWLKHRTLEGGVCTYTYPGCTPAVLDLGVVSLSWGGAGGVLGLGGAGCDGGAPVLLLVQWVCGFFAVPIWQWRPPSIWLSWTIAGCLSIAAFTLLCPGNTIPLFFSSRTSPRCYLISCCISSIAAHKNTSLASLAIFKARWMSDCSSCTQPPCLTIVADRLKTYKKSVAASRVRIGCYLNQIRLRSLLWGLLNLFLPIPGTLIT